MISFWRNNAEGFAALGKSHARVKSCAEVTDSNSATPCCQILTDGFGEEEGGGVPAFCRSPFLVTWGIGMKGVGGKGHGETEKARCGESGRLVTTVEICNAVPLESAKSKTRSLPVVSVCFFFHAWFSYAFSFLLPVLACYGCNRGLD